jgi:hypothetical protein
VSKFRTAHAQIKALIGQWQALFNNEAYQQTRLTFERYPLWAFIVPVFCQYDGLLRGCLV